MEGVQLSWSDVENADFDRAKCVICQEKIQEKVISTPNGCKQIREATDIQSDSVTKVSNLWLQTVTFTIICRTNATRSIQIQLYCNVFVNVKNCRMFRHHHQGHHELQLVLNRLHVHHRTLSIHEV